MNPDDQHVFNYTAYIFSFVIMIALLLIYRKIALEKQSVLTTEQDGVMEKKLGENFCINQLLPKRNGKTSSYRQSYRFGFDQQTRFIAPGIR